MAKRGPSEQTPDLMRTDTSTWLDEFMVLESAQKEALLSEDAHFQEMLTAINDAGTCKIKNKPELFMQVIAKKRLTCLLHLFGFKEKPERATLKAICQKGREAFSANKFAELNEDAKKAPNAFYRFFDSTLIALNNIGSEKEYASAIKDALAAQKAESLSVNQAEIRRKILETMRPEQKAEHPLIKLAKKLGAQYVALPEEDRKWNSYAITWEEVLMRIPNLSEFLVRVESLQNPVVYWINSKGQLVVGDGPPPAVEYPVPGIGDPSRGLIDMFTLKGIIKVNLLPLGVLDFD